MKKPKPCPCCGGKAEPRFAVVYARYTDKYEPPFDTSKVNVVCTVCGLTTPYYKTKKWAVEAWNKRTSE